MHLNIQLHAQELKVKDISQKLSCVRTEENIQVVSHKRAKKSVSIHTYNLKMKLYYILGKE
jgi:hypothetical protein